MNEGLLQSSEASDVEVPRRDAVINELVIKEVAPPYQSALFGAVLSMVPFIPHMMQFPWTYPIPFNGESLNQSVVVVALHLPPPHTLYSCG